MRAAIAWLVVTIVLLGVVSVGGAILAESRRPAWFTVGGPLPGLPDETAAFSPLVWKRSCLGIVWRDEQPTGEWMACAGVPFGPRREYRQLSDQHPWAPPGIPGRLEARAIAEELGISVVERAAILSWRRTGQFEEVLLVVLAKSSKWSLVRAQRFFADPQPMWEAFVSLDAPAASLFELGGPPTPGDLRRFAGASWWDKLETTPRIVDWGVAPEAWAWAIGSAQSPEEQRETERIRRYRPRERSSTELARAAESLHEFVLTPGRSVVMSAGSAAKLSSSRGDLPNFDATWTPSVADVAALERRLQELNPILYRGGASPERRVPLRRSVNDYHRQYSGLQEAGHRYIYVNAMDSGWAGEQWRTEHFFIWDGGFLAWGALYDPSTQSFLGFRVNGSG